MSYRRVVAIAAAALLLLGAGAAIAIALHKDSGPSPAQIRIEAAKNTAAAQAACYAAGGSWRAPVTSYSYVPAGPEVRGSCLSAKDEEELKTTANSIYAHCLPDPASVAKAASAHQSVNDYCLSVYSQVLKNG